MKLKVNIPDGWHEVSIGDFMEISQLDAKSKDYIFNVLSVLLDVDVQTVKNFSKESFDKILNSLEWALKSPSETEYKQVISVDGIEHRLVENLNGFTGGEWWDMEEYIANYDSNIHNIIAMIYKPLDQKVYDSEVTKQRGELFAKKLNIGDVYGATVFFSNVEKKFTMNIVDSLANMTQKQTKKK